MVRIRPHDPAIHSAQPVSSAGTFVGRQREMAVLRGGLDDAVSGRGRLFLLSGEPGIGKSRLADELGDAARHRGAEVLWGRCWEAGGAPAYWPWVQAMRAFIAGRDEDELRRHLGSGAAEVVQLVPELAELVPGVVASTPGDPDTARFRLFDAVTGFLARAAEAQPIVLIIDDLQAADVPSLLLLRFVTGELGTAAVLVVGTYRDLDLDRDHPLTATLAELARYPATRRLHLSGLEPPDVARFVQSVTGVRPPDDVALAIHRETEGNLLFLGEVVRLAAADGHLDDPDAAYWARAIPQGVREVIALRVNRLSKECSRTLSLASVLGREFEPEPLEHLSGLASEELAEVLDEATVARVVDEVPGSPGRLRFAHALIRDTLYDELPPARRARLHARSAEALEVLYGTDPEPHLAELAHHYFEAGRGAAGERAATYAHRAGDRALAQLAYEEAVRLYRMALRALELRDVVDDAARADLLLSLGDAAMRAGDAPAGRDWFLAAADAARRVDSAELLARAALGYGGRFVWARAAGDANVVPLLQDALERLGEEATPLRVRLLARLAGALRDEPDRRRRADVSAQAVELARQFDPATLAYALDGRFCAIWGPDNVEERLGIAGEIVALAEQIGDDERAFQGHHYRAAILMELGDIPALKHQLERIQRAADALQQPAQRWLVTAMAAALALLEGRLEEAEETVDRAYHGGRRAQGVHALGVFRLQGYALRCEQGRAAEMERPLAELARDYWFWLLVRAAMTHLHAELGRADDARRELDACAAADFDEWTVDNDSLLALSLFADVCTFLGDEPRAATLYGLLTPYAERNAFGHPEYSTGSVARSLGNLAGTLGRFDDAERHFAAALDMNARMGARPWVARTHHDRARMLLARAEGTDRDRAIDDLRGAHDIAAELGCVGLRDRAAAALGNLGVLVDATGEDIAPAAPTPEPAVTAARNVFRREGDYWLIAFDGRAARLHDAKGLAYLAALLERPGHEVHALDLASSHGGAARTGAVARDDLAVMAGGGDSGPALDDRARRAYRRRIEELQATIDEAEEWNDAERAARARDELDFLAHELAGATGLGGRHRRLGSDAERARVNVTRAIRSALARIREHHPELAAHLGRTVRTGTFCVYQPDPRAAPDWSVR